MRSHTRYLLVLFAVVFARVAVAQISASRVRVAADIGTAIHGTPFRDREPASVGNSTAGPFTAALGALLPDRVAIDALCATSNRIVFSSEVDFRVQGATYRDEDLVAFDPVAGSFAMFLDGSAAGLPVAADIDAATFLSPTATELYISFDAPVRLPGGVRARHNDVVRYNGSTFSIAYSAQALGIPPGANIDALHSDGDLYFSLDVTAGNAHSAPGITATDHEFWTYIPAGPNVVPFSGMPIAPAADVVAMDEPIDRDGDWLSDFEESTGIDEAATTFPGRDIPLSPNGRLSSPTRADSDSDGQHDGAEAAARTHPNDDTDYLHVTKITREGPGGKIYRVEGRRCPASPTSSA